MDETQAIKMIPHIYAPRSTTQNGHNENQQYQGMFGKAVDESLISIPKGDLEDLFFRRASGIHNGEFV